LSDTLTWDSALQRFRQLRPWRGYAFAVFLSLLFLGLTAYVSAVTLLTRVTQTSVMKAASDAAIAGQIGREVLWVLIAQVLLHLAFAAVAWLAAVSSAVLWPRARLRFNLYVAAWFSLFAAAVVAYNAYWFPRTLMGAYYHDVFARSLGSWDLGPVFYVGVAVAGLLVIIAAFVKAERKIRVNWPLRKVAMATTGVLAIGATAVWASGRAAAPAIDPARPNVIILGIDSLRLDQLRRFGGLGPMPNVDAFLSKADVMSDATTPAARTFSSWMAILTGRSPVVTGARYNLAPRDLVKSNPTIADVLRGQGYHTVYSTDEVRFANIDESYGFDQVITPRIGASDFLIGTYNDLPLASVVINTKLGRALFPFSYGNRGVATMYQPETYLGRIERELRFDQPTLFIAHLTSAHWPYYVSDTPFGIQRSSIDEINPLYLIGLQTADQMFGELVDMLDRKGALENTLVIVLSDHGEAFGLDSDTLMGKGESMFIEGLRAPIKMNDFGHGQSVLSPVQYKVLLGFRTFGAFDPFRSEGKTYASPVTVEDLSPTILGLLGIPADRLDSTGESFASILETGQPAPGTFAADRLRFTETDLAVLPGPKGEVDENATAQQNSKFFSVVPATGRLELNERLAPLATTFKERATYSDQFLLAAIPAGPYAHQYLLFDLHTGKGRLLLDRPGVDDREAQRLWDGLHDHYRGELKAPSAVTREDWTRIDSEWEQFYRQLAGLPVARADSTSRKPDDSANMETGKGG
jgi:hypothetical protein